MNTYKIYSLKENGEPITIMDFKACYLKVDSQKNILAYDDESKLIEVFPAGLFVIKQD